MPPMSGHWIVRIGLLAIPSTMGAYATASTADSRPWPPHRMKMPLLLSMRETIQRPASEGLMTDTTVPLRCAAVGFLTSRVMRCDVAWARVRMRCTSFSL